MGKRSNEWVKFKRMADEDYVVAGYIQKGHHVFSMVIEKYRGDMLLYKGHVTAGVTKEIVSMLEVTGRNPFRMLPTGNEDAVWAKAGSCLCSGVFAKYLEFIEAAGI